MTSNKHSPVQSVLEKFAIERPLFEEFSLVLGDLLGTLVRAEGIVLQSISKRAKDVSSLQGKLTKTGKAYQSLSDVTDLAGIRIITYFADDVDRVARLVEREFEIDVVNSADKRTTDPDRFGYASLHYVLGFGTLRRGLAEYRKFGQLKAELQVRSLLQHAWAEIEHDLGYKSKRAIPVSFRRRFARLAGLLEIADSEFGAIRSQLSSYEEKVSSAVRESDQQGAVEIDQISLAAFVRNDDVAVALDDYIAGYFGGGLEDVPSYVSLEGLDLLGIRNIAELREALKARQNQIRTFVDRWLSGNRDEDGAPRGISIFYLGYVMAAESRNATVVQKYLAAVGVDVSTAARVLDTAGGTS